MNFRESLSLSPNCALRKDFPDGEVYVQMSGVEGPRGPAYVALYNKPWEAVPRAPIMNVKTPLGTTAHVHVESALSAEHDDYLSDSDCDCIALDSVGAIIRHRQERIVV